MAQQLETKRYAGCVFCGHLVRVREASKRQVFRYAHDYQTYRGEYFVGTCPACQMRDCHHIDETLEEA